MGSRIEAIIYDGAGHCAALRSGLPVVPLPGSCCASLWPRWPGRSPWAAGHSTSSGRPSAGEGTQEAIGWQDGKLWYGPSGTCDVEADLEPGYHLVWRWDGAVNVGLRGLGVARAAGLTVDKQTKPIGDEPRPN